jgi:hypothetical protein
MSDSSVRAVLYEAPHIILTRPIQGGALKSWAMRLAKRTGMKKAKVAGSPASSPSCCTACGLAPVLSISKKRAVACAPDRSESSATG